MSAIRLFLLFSVVCTFSIVHSARAQETQPESPAPNDQEDAVDPLDLWVEKAISISSRRYLDADVHTPWQILHGILALRSDFVIKKDGEKVSALEWMAQGATYRNQPWFEVTRYGGRAHPYSRPYIFEGHPNQTLAILARAGVPAETQLKADSGMISVADMVNHAKMHVNANEEVTWTLWALSYYLGPDAEWTNRFGEAWSIERLAQLQLRADIENAACGGTHAMFALTFARDIAAETGKPLRGVWLEVDQKIRASIETARAFQNSDGSFSTAHFRGRGYSSDFETRCATSGHMAEFIALALPLERYSENWFRRGIYSVAKELVDHRSEPVECGPLYHAVSGLVVYRDRLHPATEDAASDDAPPVEVPSPGESREN